jgi:hypothetical protein
LLPVEKLIHFECLEKRMTDRQTGFRGTQPKCYLIKDKILPNTARVQENFLDWNHLPVTRDDPEETNSADQEAESWQWYVQQFLSTLRQLQQLAAEDGHQTVHVCATHVPALSVLEMPSDVQCSCHDAECNGSVYAGL